MPKPFILQQHEATSGILAKQLNLHQSALSVMLSDVANAPKPLRIVGRTRIYDAKQVIAFHAKIAEQHDVRQFANKLVTAANLQRRQAIRAGRTDLTLERL